MTHGPFVRRLIHRLHRSIPYPLGPPRSAADSVFFETRFFGGDRRSDAVVAFLFFFVDVGDV